MIPKFTLTGDQRLLENLRGLQRRFPARVAAALYRQGERIMTDSKENYVPVDLGTLKGSGKVVLENASARSTTVVMSYGGAAKDYALAVHEHPSTASPPSWRGKDITFQPQGHGTKYLERPMLDHARTLARDLAADIDLGGI